MNGRCTPGAISSSSKLSTRYGPIRQYCSSRMWSSIQPLPGRLQQRVVQEEQEHAAGGEDTGHLGDGLVDRLDVLEDEARDDAVEGARPGTGARPRRRVRTPVPRRVRRRCGAGWPTGRCR